MNLSSRTKFGIAVLIPLLILLGLTVKPAATAAFGQKILLETRAVDPTDLFRGDYVYLTFKVADVPRSELPGVADQEIVYVTLKQEGRYHVVDSVSLEKPKEGVYLKGRLHDYPGNEMYFVDYSLDKYFVEQGTGRELEQGSSQGTLEGTVKVWNGYALLLNVAEKEQE